MVFKACTTLVDPARMAWGAVGTAKATALNAATVTMRVLEMVSMIVE